MRPFRARIRSPFRPQAGSRFPILPTLITLGNATCGLVSIAVLTTPQTQLDQASATFYAGLLIYLGLLLDGVDGHVARLAKQTSEFGIQLDSLCDAVTFGVAPVFIMLSFSGEIFYLRLLWSVGVMFTLCVLLRLARHNVDAAHHDGQSHFRGLPSPAAAGTVASFAIAMPSLLRMTDPSMPLLVQQWSHWGIRLIQLGTPLMTLLLAFLMVSPIRYPHVMKDWLQNRHNFYRLAQAIFVVAAVVTIHEFALPLLFGLFAFGHPLLALWRRWFMTPAPAVVVSADTEISSEVLGAGPPESE